MTELAQCLFDAQLVGARPLHPDAIEFLRANVGGFETSPFYNFGEVSKATPKVNSRAKQGLYLDGTVCVASPSILSVVPKNPDKPKRGGARNKASRFSDALTIDDVSKALAGIVHAYDIGLPINRMTTIHWERAGVPLQDMVAATGRYIDLQNKTIARHGGRTTWLSIHEGGEDKGGHCHLLSHIPMRLVKRVTGRQKRWLKAITDRPYRKDVVHSDPIGGRLGLEETNPKLHFANLMAIMEYVLKGADETAAEAFRLTRLQPGGLVYGRRCSTAQNIGSKARTIWNAAN